MTRFGGIQRRPRQTRRRRGTAIVEAAVMAPLMLAGTLGIAELGYIYMAKQTVTLAAREGARAACLPGGVSGDATTAANNTMNRMGLTGYSVSVDMGSDTDPTVTVVVSLPFSEASFTGSMFGGRTLNLASTASMRREDANNDTGITGS